MPLTPTERTLRARTAAYTKWSEQDAVEGTKPARRGWSQKFDDQVDPDRKLPEAERKRRAKAAMKAYMAGLALKSAKARRTRKQAAS